MFRMLCTSRFARVRSRNKRISIDKRFREMAVGVWSQLNYLPVGIRGRIQLRFAGIQSFHLINSFLHWIPTLLYCFGIFHVIILLIKYYFKIDISCSDHNEYYYLRNVFILFGLLTKDISTCFFCTFFFWLLLFQYGMYVVSVSLCMAIISRLGY